MFHQLEAEQCLLAVSAHREHAVAGKKDHIGDL
jgi:hypothetical protein